MAFDFKIENLADEGQVPFNVVTGMTASGHKITFTPEWKEDKWNTRPASFGIKGKGLKSLFMADDETGKARARVEGVSTENSSHYQVTERDKISILAQNFGVPAKDIDHLSYWENDDRSINEVSVTLRAGIVPELEAMHRNAFALAMEKHGFAEPGLAFKLAEGGYSAPEVVGLNLRGENNIDFVQFKASNNATGQPFIMFPKGEDKTRVEFGDNFETEYGSMFRKVSDGDRRAAEKIAALFNAQPNGETGITSAGLVVIIDRPLPQVIARMADHGQINKGVAQLFEDAFDKGELSFACNNFRAMPKARTTARTSLTLS